jgi:hypothetical protein
VQQGLKRDPFCGQLFLFRSRRADRLKALWWDGSGLCLFAKRLERGRFVWPQVKEGAITLTPAQLAMLIEASTGVGRLFSGIYRGQPQCSRSFSIGCVFAGCADSRALPAGMRLEIARLPSDPVLL